MCMWKRGGSVQVRMMLTESKIVLIFRVALKKKKKTVLVVLCICKALHYDSLSSCLMAL